ncbi:Di-copper centre-containing domain superfamily protein [Pleurotus pulmonarius]
MTLWSKLKFKRRRALPLGHLHLLRACFPYELGLDLTHRPLDKLYIEMLVRREWRKISRSERRDWIDAIKCLTKLPHSPVLTPIVNPDDIAPVNITSSYYDDIVYLHMDLNRKESRVHGTGLFLPWHRWYIHNFESALKEKCGFNGTLPYWDWTRDAPDFLHATIFDEEYELGGCGEPSRDFELVDGAFSGPSLFRPSYPFPHTLRRNFTLFPYTASVILGVPIDPHLPINNTFSAAEVRKLTTGFQGDYKGFQTYIEGIQGAHASVHLIVNGDLLGACPRTAPPGCMSGPTFTPNDPLFWLHHAMIDKVWHDWQHNSIANTRAFEGGSVQRLDNITMWPTGSAPWMDLQTVMPADGLFSENTVVDVIDTEDGLLCYTYE